MAEIVNQTEITQVEVSIDIDKNEALASAMTERLDKLPGNPSEREPITIFRVPAYIRNKNKELYEPQIIPIGPYHHGAKRLQAVEEHKWRYLRNLLSRKKKFNLVTLIIEMRLLEDKARRAYNESFSLGSDEFVKMMVLDSCFIIELLLDKEPFQWDISLGYYDLFLLENQVPYFIIERLCSTLFPEKGTDLFISLLGIFMFNHNEPIDPDVPEIYHLVHLYYHWFVPTRAFSKTRVQPIFKRCLTSLWLPLFPCSLLSREGLIRSRANKLKLTTGAPTKLIPSATYLREVGIKFKRKTSPENIFHVTFEKGIFEIPSVLIDNNRIRLLLNLIAFEQSNPSIRPKHLTSFATLMDLLINTPADVEILEECGILQNMLPSAKDAACFFNQICECVTPDYDTHYLSGLFQDVRNYCDSTWHRNRARLVRDYFYNPWAILSLIAAITLLFLSFIQSFFSAYSYFRPPR